MHEKFNSIYSYMYIYIYIYMTEWFFFRVKNTARLCSFFYLPPPFPLTLRKQRNEKKKRWKVFHPSSFFQSLEFRVQILFRIDLIWSDLVREGVRACVRVCVRKEKKEKGKEKERKKKRKRVRPIFIFI